jgi:hypothetical protein
MCRCPVAHSQQLVSKDEPWPGVMPVMSEGVSQPSLELNYGLVSFASLGIA